MKTIEYPGSCDNFRAFMEGFLLSFTKSSCWLSPNGELLVIYYISDAHIQSRDIWGIEVAEFDKDKEIIKGSGERQASIFVLESLPNKTTIQFIDGTYCTTIQDSQNQNAANSIWKIESGLIGNSLDELFNEIQKQIKQSLPVTNKDFSPKEPQSKNLEEWFDYYYAVKPRLRIKMDYIAEKVGYAVSTVYKEHTNYKNSHDIPKRKIAVRKSKKK